MVRAAIAGEQPLEIIGHGTKRLIGQPMATNALLDLSALNAVTSYEPNELIITVQAGAPLADVQVADRFQESAVRVRADRHRAAAGHAGHRHHRRHDRRRPRRSAPHQGRRRPRSSAGRACGVRLRRQFQGRRPGGEERHRLRSLQTAGGVLGHARGHDGSDAEGDAEARERAHAGAARARRCHREPGDDRGAGLAVRCVRRGASAEFGVSAPQRARSAASDLPREAVTLLRLEGIAASVAHRAGCARQAAGAVRRGGNCCRTPPRPRSGLRFATSSRSRPAARWGRGRCGGSSVRRPRAARSARRWRATPAAT